MQVGRRSDHLAILSRSIVTSVDNGRQLVWRRVEDRRRSVILELCGLLPMLEVLGEDEKRDGRGGQVDGAVDWAVRVADICIS